MKPATVRMDLRLHRLFRRLREWGSKQRRTGGVDDLKAITRRELQLEPGCAAMNIDLRPCTDTHACGVVLDDVVVPFRTVQEAEAFVATLRRRIGEPHAWPRPEYRNQAASQEG